ncbi:MAG: type II toxin-antitoxin system prevent-host-death family antitoxin [Synergistaceae bacterium]|jgi:antitoxin (DNA-binding transcriptional repressor) of toxin-antitoxin stability system|nr:type II toxin-antitoxin system prevent-host-death family antitoxin [Synergistaceae bacterium]
MVITATELKTNIGKYLNILHEENIYVTKKGKVVAKISDPVEDKVTLLDSLVGIIPENAMTLDEAKRDRMARQ